ncbi:MAG: hypothetical protein ACPG4T_07915 [Nannocystaceae bacterium]
MPTFGDGFRPFCGCRALADSIGVCVQLSNHRQLHLIPQGEPVVPKPMTVAGYGMQLHAATTVDGRDRRRLERLCRYLLRPPFAQNAVKARPDGQVRI